MSAQISDSSSTDSTVSDLVAEIKPRYMMLETTTYQSMCMNIVIVHYFTILFLIVDAFCVSWNRLKRFKSRIIFCLFYFCNGAPLSHVKLFEVFRLFIKWKCANSQVLFKMRHLGWNIPVALNAFHTSLGSPSKYVMVSWHFIYNFSIWYVILMSGIMYIQSICGLILKGNILELEEGCRKSPKKWISFFYRLCLYVMKIYAAHIWADEMQLLLIKLWFYCLFQCSFITFWHLHCWR